MVGDLVLSPRLQQSMNFFSWSPSPWSHLTGRVSSILHTVARCAREQICRVIFISSPSRHRVPLALHPPQHGVKSTDRAGCAPSASFTQSRADWTRFRLAELAQQLRVRQNELQALVSVRLLAYTRCVSCADLAHTDRPAEGHRAGARSRGALVRPTSPSLSLVRAC